MSRVPTILWIITLTMFPMLSYATELDSGSKVDGGIFLYREAVDLYWNDWIAFPLMEEAEIPTSSQARVTIIGEGKSASFIGNLSINCRNGRHLWESAGSWSEFLNSNEQVLGIVPENVITNAIKHICK